MRRRAPITAALGRARVEVWNPSGSVVEAAPVFVLNKIYPRHLSSGFQAVSHESRRRPLRLLISRLVNKSGPTAQLRLGWIPFGSRPPCTFNLDRLGGGRGLCRGSAGVRLLRLGLTGEMRWNWGFVGQSHLIISFRPFGLAAPGDGSR